MQVHWQVDLFQGLQDLSHTPHVVSLTLAYELEALCAVLSTGHVLTIDLAGHDRYMYMHVCRCTNALHRSAEEVGCVADGVLAAAWSPGGTILALVTAARHVVALGLVHWTV